MVNNYDNTNIATMEMIYGEGYLSAGGDEDVALILDGLDVSGKQVLDAGCGLGGATVTLARDHGAWVTGLDIDSTVLARANELVEKANVGDRVVLKHFEPGPFPVEDNRFDLVYVTAVTCHVVDLVGFFKDIRRVLKQGGVVVGRDWFKISDNWRYRKWDSLLRDKGLNFHFVDIDTFRQALNESGFAKSRIMDRTDFIARLARDAVNRVDNDLAEDLRQVLGEQGYQDCRKWTEIRADALTHGGIGQSQFRAE